jgi:cytochrome P450
VIAQSILFLIAGFETSSTLLAFISYELVINQNIQVLLREEIYSVLERHNGKCTYEALQEMPLLDMVLMGMYCNNNFDKITVQKSIYIPVYKTNKLN